MQDKSVITFYKLFSHHAANMTWQEASKFVAENYGREAICADVVHTNLDPVGLASCVAVWMLKDEDLREEIEQKRMQGVNFLFVAPVVGNPVWGHPLV